MSREEGVKALRYVHDASGLEAAFAAVRSAAAAGVLAQEYVRGTGYGMSALYWNGRRERTFMHRRCGSGRERWHQRRGESLPSAPARARRERRTRRGWVGTAWRWSSSRGIPRRGSCSSRSTRSSGGLTTWRSPRGCGFERSRRVAGGSNAGAATARPGGALPPGRSVGPLARSGTACFAAADPVDAISPRVRTV